MLRQVRLKCRCRLLFSDLKGFLLRRPPPPPPPPVMNYDQISRPINSRILTNNNTLLPAAKGGKWRAGDAPGEECPQEQEYGAYEQPMPLMSPSAEESYRRKCEDGVSLSSSIASGCRSPLCRICFQGSEQGDLLSPCRCAGSVRCTHQPCLIKWISERGSWSCELCYYKYHVIAISAKNPLQWQAISLTVIERVQIAAAILGSLFLIASISWLIWSTISPSAKWQRQDLLFQICYGMYGFMDIVCIGLIIHEGPSVYRIFKRWQAVNQQWKVLNYEKSKDLEDQKSSMNRNRNSRTERSSTTHNSSRGNQPMATMSDHHCAYTILHILSHLRSNEQRHQPNANRELVMRVTTV
ncbi:E3 ubiquitin-protein ligase MARCHF4-like isoform X1 [Stegostoma tigrinum]|uniref:E3 ubiquitin-protein ligase MARCHF4-like isoform X1 n=1 Tax=Stegostoma tigrinum TaxID=3053191 RepID=UPI00202B1B4C|nr:E3 ubiquitin-protein ligase MARCHF4-like isoform X1 [Stegostoma tigrinum]